MEKEIILLVSVGHRSSGGWCNVGSLGSSRVLVNRDDASGIDDLSSGDGLWCDVRLLVSQYDSNPSSSSSWCVESLLLSWLQERKSYGCPSWRFRQLWRPWGHLFVFERKATLAWIESNRFFFFFFSCFQKVITYSWLVDWQRCRWLECVLGWACGPCSRACFGRTQRSSSWEPNRNRYTSSRSCATTQRKREPLRWGRQSCHKQGICFHLLRPSWGLRVPYRARWKKRRSNQSIKEDGGDNEKETYSRGRRCLGSSSWWSTSSGASGGSLGCSTSGWAWTTSCRSSWSATTWWSSSGSEGHTLILTNTADLVNLGCSCKKERILVSLSKVKSNEHLLTRGGLLGDASDLMVTHAGLVDLAVGLVFEGFDGLQVQSQTARRALEADFVPEGTASRDTLVGVGSLATSRALFSLSVAWNKWHLERNFF